MSKQSDLEAHKKYLLETYLSGEPTQSHEHTWVDGKCECGMEHPQPSPPSQKAIKAAKEWLGDDETMLMPLAHHIQSAIDEAYERGYTQCGHDEYFHRRKAESRPAQCAGPRQHGNPLEYESHCEHGETKAHKIESRPAQEIDSSKLPPLKSQRVPF